MIEKQAVTVSQLTSAISALIDGGLGTQSVVGEISNFVQHSSGHRYFSLKDQNAQISAVMWRSRNLTFIPKDGMKVVVTGKVTVYPQRGQYQIDCNTMRPLGQGDLYAAFEQLKQDLEAKGYFDIERKKPIPRVSLNIGVITSPTGAAVQDIKTTIARRMPIATVHLRKTIVQGDEAAPDIAKAISEMDALGLDVIICGRGGGSIEDLWAFNTEIVANAIYNCKTPIISAVGHETDFTIADFVADQRAATPTAAAELATPIQRVDILNFVDEGIASLKDIISGNIESHKVNIDNLSKSYAIRRITDNVNNKKQYTDENIVLLKKTIDKRIDKIKAETNHLQEMLRTLNPMNPLNKGFALIKSKGKIIGNDTSLKSLEQVQIQRANESADATITKVYK